MHLLDYTKRTLKLYGVKPTKGLGQSFLVDEHVMERMVGYANLESRDVVLEIGSGLGLLTELLAEKAGMVIAVEVDAKLLTSLREKFGRSRKVKLYSGDYLKLKIEERYSKVVSSPPYSTVSKILFKLLDEKFSLGILLLQEDFARRLVAKAGTKEYGRLTVMAYMKAEVELTDKVPSSAFYPAPKVSSVVVKVTPREENPFEVDDWTVFEQTVRFAFTQRNRKVRNALRAMSRLCSFAKPIKPYHGIPFLERRVFTLTPEEFGELSNALYNQSS